MLPYWFFGLLMVVPLLAVAAVISVIARRYAIAGCPWVGWIGRHQIVLWGGLCVVNGLYWWHQYYADNPTVYAPHYTETLFQQVAIGMDTAQVRALVGEPLEKWPPYQDGRYPNWHYYIRYSYSHNVEKGDYNVRQLNFENGRVAQVISYRYYD